MDFTDSDNLRLFGFRQLYNAT